MIENEAKTIFQFKLANYWFKKGCNGSYILPTGTSKTRIGVEIAKHLINKYGYEKGDILVVTPSESIRDVTWPEEFLKWSSKEHLDKIEIECIQSIYLDRTPRKFIIYDEIHNYINNYNSFIDGEGEYVKFVQEIKAEKTLGLSAFISPRKRKTIKELCPILYEMSIEQALDKGFISNFHIYNIPVDFTASQREEYNNLEKEIDECAENLGGNMVAYSNAMSIIKGLKGCSFDSLSKKNKILLSRSLKYRKLIGERKLLLEKNTNKIQICKELIEYYKGKSIVFFSSKEVANLFAEQDETHIAKMHSSVYKKKRGKILEEFEIDNSPIKTLSAVNAINEGVNVPKVKFSILASGNSTQKDLTQRLGRNLRFDNSGKSAIFVQLYIPDTQDEKWTKTRSNVIQSKHITYLSNYKHLLPILN